MLVRDLMTTEPVTVTPRTGVKDALTTLARLGITSMPVVAGDRRLLGIVSEADLIRDAVARDARAQDSPVMVEPLDPPRSVDDVYTRATIWVGPSDDVATAVDVMTSTAVKSLPVLDDDGRLVGVLSRSDVVRALARSDAMIAADIDAVLTALGHEDWLVEVHDGVVEVSGPGDLAQHSLAHVVARAVPGVGEVHVS